MQNRMLRKPGEPDGVNTLPDHYSPLVKQLRPLAHNVQERWSRKGVPHLVISEHSGVCSSICFFSRHQSWRVFRPYPSDEQTRTDFSSIEAVVNHYKEL